MTQLSLLLSLSFLRRHQPNYFSHELVITVIFFKNTMQEMSCHAAFSCRKRNNSFVCVVSNEDFFFPQRKAVLGSFNLFRTSYNFSPKSTWWFINTYVCTVILNLRILKFSVCKVSICLECMYVVKHERSTRVANLLERWLCCSAHSHILPLEVNWSLLQVKISKWIHRWFFSAFESFWL